jgi:hypothetical protein
LFQRIYPSLNDALAAGAYLNLTLQLQYFKKQT